MTPSVPLLVLALFFVLPIGSTPGGGIESRGTTDGLLTWDLGSLQPGSSARQTVLFAYADSYDALLERIQSAKRVFEELAEPRSKNPKSAPERVVWIRNEETNLALDGAGAFFWEGNGQALVCSRGGQLSRFGYAFHYNDGESKQAGVSVTKEGETWNLRTLVLK